MMELERSRVLSAPCNRADPSSSKAYYSLMLCLVQSAASSKTSGFKEGTRLDPFNMLYQTSAGWLEYYAKRPRVAIEKLEEALTSIPRTRTPGCAGSGQ